MYVRSNSMSMLSLMPELVVREPRKHNIILRNNAKFIFVLIHVVT